MADLDIPDLPAAAQVAHLFPALGGQSLLSIGQLCDAGCEANFTARTVSILLGPKLILTSQRDPITRLWTVNTVTPTPHDPEQALLVNHTTKPAELVAFAHAALFSPALSMLQTALDKGFITHLPGLTPATLRPHPPQSVATIKGHLDQHHQNLRPTTKPPTELPLLSVDPATADADTDAATTASDAFPATDFPSEHTNFCYAACMPTDTTGQIFTDQRGRFILPASTGNTQLFILYDYGINSIQSEPMPSKSGTTILAAYKAVHNQLVCAGLHPKLQRLDNEFSAALKEFLRDEHIDF
jgi:hypothetical protein